MSVLRGVALLLAALEVGCAPTCTTTAEKWVGQPVSAAVAKLGVPAENALSGGHREYRWSRELVKPTYVYGPPLQESCASDDRSYGCTGSTADRNSQGILRGQAEQSSFALVADSQGEVASWSGDPRLSVAHGEKCTE